MKIHRVVQMLGATTTSGKLASDMYDLNYKTYYSEADGKDIPISHMDFQHLIRAFIKMMDKVERCMKERNFLQEENENLEVNAEYWKAQYRIANDLLRIKGDKKMFSEIPNNSFGKSLVDNMKAYLNKDSYRMRVRGQYLDDETKQSEGWRKYDRGQPIDKSKCLRVYIDTK